MLEKIEKNAPRNWAVLLIDNCSRDKTLNRALSYLEKGEFSHPYKVFQNSWNLNLGGSHKIAIDFAIREKFEWIIVLHGDDQADIQDLFTSGKVQEMNLANFECLLGSRFSRGSTLTGYSPIRRIGNKLLMRLYPKIEGRVIADMGSGLNCYSVQSLRSINWSLIPDDLTFNNYLLLNLIKLKSRVTFFPISWREEDQDSNASPFLQSLKILYGILLFRIGVMKKVGSATDVLPPPITIRESKLRD